MYDENFMNTVASSSVPYIYQKGDLGNVLTRGVARTTQISKIELFTKIVNGLTQKTPSYMFEYS